MVANAPQRAASATIMHDVMGADRQPNASWKSPAPLARARSRMREAFYTNLARYYDLIYSNKPYVREARAVTKMIERTGRSASGSLLEVGCGTGRYLEVFEKASFRCWGIDVSRDMLALARKRAPKSKLIRADMRDFALGRRFDTVVCLFSSIGYVRSEAELGEAVQRMADHVAPGGLLIIEPWLTPETYGVGEPKLQTYSSPHLHIARAAVTERTGNRAVLDFHWMIAEAGKRVVHRNDRHELALLPRASYLKALTDAGLRGRALRRGLRPGFGMFIGEQN
jgi:SAM-dependent methyltransferase